MAGQASAEVRDKHIFSPVSTDFRVRYGGVGVRCVSLVQGLAQSSLPLSFTFLSCNEGDMQPVGLGLCG